MVKPTWKINVIHAINKGSIWNTTSGTTILETPKGYHRRGESYLIHIT